MMEFFKSPDQMDPGIGISQRRDSILRMLRLGWVLNAGRENLTNLFWTVGFKLLIQLVLHIVGFEAWIFGLYSYIDPIEKQTLTLNPLTTYR